MFSSAENPCPLRGCHFDTMHPRMTAQEIARRAQQNPGNPDDDLTYRSGAADPFLEDEDFDMVPDVPFGCPLRGHFEDAERMLQSDPELAEEFMMAFQIVYAWTLAGCHFNSGGYLNRRGDSIIAQAQQLSDQQYSY